MTIERDAIRRSICFIIWSPDVQNRGIQFLLKFTSKRCSVEQYRKGKYVHPMGVTVISATMLSVLDIHIHTAEILANLLLEKKVTWISLCANIT